MYYVSFTIISIFYKLYAFFKENYSTKEQHGKREIKKSSLINKNCSICNLTRHSAASLDIKFSLYSEYNVTKSKMKNTTCKLITH